MISRVVVTTERGKTSIFIKGAEASFGTDSEADDAGYMKKREGLLFPWGNPLSIP